MTDKTPLQKLFEIEQIFDPMIRRSLYFGDLREKYLALEKQAIDDAIKSEAAREYWEGQGWVRAKDRLPKKNEEYITCGVGISGNIVTTLEWKNKKWFSDVFQKYVDQIKITHWRPLPAPPNQ